MGGSRLKSSSPRMQRKQTAALDSGAPPNGNRKSGRLPLKRTNRSAVGDHGKRRRAERRASHDQQCSGRAKAVPQNSVIDLDSESEMQASPAASSEPMPEAQSETTGAQLSPLADYYLVEEDAEGSGASAEPVAPPPPPEQGRRLNIDSAKSKLYVITARDEPAQPPNPKLFLLIHDEDEPANVNDATTGGGAASRQKVTLITSIAAGDTTAFKQTVHKILPGILNSISSQRRQNGNAHGPHTAPARRDGTGTSAPLGATPVIVSNARHMAQRSDTTAERQQGRRMAAASIGDVARNHNDSNGGDPVMSSGAIGLFLQNNPNMKCLKMTSDLSFLFSLMPLLERIPADHKEHIKESIKLLLLSGIAEDN